MVIAVERVEVSGSEGDVEALHPRTVVEIPSIDGDTHREGDAFVQRSEVPSRLGVFAAHEMMSSRAATTSSMVVTDGTGAGGGTTEPSERFMTPSTVVTCNDTRFEVTATGPPDADPPLV